MRKTLIAISLAAFSLAAFASASWNGQMRFTTQNGQSGVSCGYYVNGSTMWIFFPNTYSCPNSI